VDWISVVRWPQQRSQSHRLVEAASAATSGTVQSNARHQSSNDRFHRSRHL
jgi:hypothetical protein